MVVFVFSFFLSTKVDIYLKEKEMQGWLQHSYRWRRKKKRSILKKVASRTTAGAAAGAAAAAAAGAAAAALLEGTLKNIINALRMLLLSFRNQVVRQNSPLALLTLYLQAHTHTSVYVYVLLPRMYALYQLVWPVGLFLHSSCTGPTFLLPFFNDRELEKELLFSGDF